MSGRHQPDSAGSVCDGGRWRQDERLQHRRRRVGHRIWTGEEPVRPGVKLALEITTDCISCYIPPDRFYRHLKWKLCKYYVKFNSKQPACGIAVQNSIVLVAVMSATQYRIYFTMVWNIIERKRRFDKKIGFMYHHHMDSISNEFLFLVS